MCNTVYVCSPGCPLTAPFLSRHRSFLGCNELLDAFGVEKRRNSEHTRLDCWSAHGLLCYASGLRVACAVERHDACLIKLGVACWRRTDSRPQALLVPSACICGKLPWTIHSDHGSACGYCHRCRALEQAHLPRRSRLLTFDEGLIHDRPAAPYLPTPRLAPCKIAPMRSLHTALDPPAVLFSVVPKSAQCAG